MDGGDRPRRIARTLCVFAEKGRSHPLRLHGKTFPGHPAKTLLPTGWGGVSAKLVSVWELVRCSHFPSYGERTQYGLQNACLYGGPRPGPPLVRPRRPPPNRPDLLQRHHRPLGLPNTAKTPSRWAVTPPRPTAPSPARKAPKPSTSLGMSTPGAINRRHSRGHHNLHHRLPSQARHHKEGYPLRPRHPKRCDKRRPRWPRRPLLPSRRRPRLHCRRHGPKPHGLRRFFRPAPCLDLLQFAPRLWCVRRRLAHLRLHLRLRHRHRSGYDDPLRGRSAIRPTDDGHPRQPHQAPVPVW